MVIVASSVGSLAQHMISCNRAILNEEKCYVPDLFDPDTQEVIAGSPADYREHDYVGDASASSTWDTTSRQDKHGWRDNPKAVAEAATKRKEPPLGPQCAHTAWAIIEKVRREPEAFQTGLRKCSRENDAELLYAAYWQDHPHDSFTQLSPSDLYSVDHDVAVIQGSLGYRAQCKLPLTGLGVKNLRSDWRNGGQRGEEASGGEGHDILVGA